NMPWADDQLQKMDQALLGLDWVALVTFVDDRKFLSYALNVAYGSFPYQLLALPLILASAGQVLRSYQMTLIWAVICFISCVVSIWYPALGTYSIYNVDPSDLENLQGAWGTVFLRQLNAVRDQADFVLDLTKAQGIMTFPSVHAAIAVLSAWAAWGVKWLRYPICLLNVLMATSAAIVANHYVVDVIAGIGVAGFSISAVQFCFVPGSSKAHSPAWRDFTENSPIQSSCAGN
ncbi:phosphatase PAP2 family protein, partial [Mesorhizobium sp. IMUNJ 23033]|uniref:phosphatase PAP2 family protein n=1 Tax=Mesorhizobium sp. IMUNJ 23033 TaxID=3378039 RepID=UPI0038507580